MSLKANRIWAQRSEAIAILASLPVEQRAGATVMVCALFNSTEASVTADADKQREKLVTLITQQRAKEDALLAEHAAKQATGTDGKGTQPASTQPDASKGKGK